MGRKKPIEPVIDLEKARSLVKVCAVLLRDHSLLSYHDASLQLAWCWRHTETEAQAEAREARE